MTQLHFLKQALRLDSKCDHETEISSSQATGIVYLALGDDGAWIGFNFSADVEHPYESICRGHWYSRAYDYSKVESVSDLKVTYADSYGCDGFNYAARIDEIKSIITRFIESAEIETDNTMQLKGNEKQKYIPQGLLTLVMDFDDKGDYALLQKVQICMTESVEYPLTDGGDVLNFCELLSDSIGKPVYANEKHRQAKKLTHFQLSNILGAA